LTSIIAKKIVYINYNILNVHGANFNRQYVITSTFINFIWTVHLLFLFVISTNFNIL